MSLLHAISVGNVNALEERDAISLTLISNCLDNNTISDVQSCIIARLTWTKLTRLIEP
jgi:hypothetical protein